MKREGQVCPYHEIIDDILWLAHRAVALDTRERRAVALVAQLRAIAFVNHFHALDDVVPAPTVLTSTDGGVVLGWELLEHAVEMVYLPAGGAFRVIDRKSSEVLQEGQLDEVDPLNDVVCVYVLGRPAAFAS